MTFISSAKPEGSFESDLNQFLALGTWVGSADSIVYFSKARELLSRPEVVFVEVEEYPEIFRLAHLASRQPSWSCILNADIRVKPLAKVVEQLERKHMKAATSYRWQGDPPAVIDPGLDFFLALPEVWADVEEKIPKTLRMGSNQWDSWMLSYFATYQTEWYADLTPAKVVYHPIHNHRKRGPEPEGIQLMGWPVMSPLRIQ